LLAFSVLDPDHPAYGYAERAAALSNRLPPRAASHVRALRSLLNADFTAARRELGGLVAQDSNDVDALEELAGLEFLDPLLVATPTGERRRGSLNAATRLSRRVLDLDPTRHGAYQGLVVIYSLAAGQSPGAMAGYRRELPRPVRSSVRAWCSCDFELGVAGQPPGRGSDSALALQFAGPDLMLVPLLRDLLELVRAGSPAALVAEWLAASRSACCGWRFVRHRSRHDRSVRLGHESVRRCRRLRACAGCAGRVQRPAGRAPRAGSGVCRYGHAAVRIRVRAGRTGRPP